MARRVYIGNSGGVFKFRASKMAGIDVLGATEAQMAIHENMAPPIPYESGVVSCGPGRSTIGLSRSYAVPPFVIVRCAENWAPSSITYFATFVPGSTLRIENKMGITLNVRYLIFSVG